ncbi:hypothetical protein ['Catharanthus roseus' aster yellows phytoplasma]|uniref:Uncharacterized protein n=1 Tax='Catharanthus roseus' aster yellows phytoplasma TaxID=1193712 RepID=A0A4V0Z8Y5_9MOLU|nr:hypothetical protein ['Catharanthus roseus' aster yellows phytoplasma]QBF23886.1 hypothetical protein EXT02_01610 ['Catharanthus roseus' aster yellows phytoplasma]
MILLAIPIIIFFSLEEESPQGSSSDEVIEQMQFSDETQNPNSAPSSLEKKSLKDAFIEKSGEFFERAIKSPKVSQSIKTFSNKLSSTISKSFSQNKNQLPRKA